MLWPRPTPPQCLRMRIITGVLPWSFCRIFGVLPAISGWWFRTCFIFLYFGHNHPIWLIFFPGGSNRQPDIHGAWGMSMAMTYKTVWNIAITAPSRQGGIFTIAHFVSLWASYSFSCFFPQPNSFCSCISLSHICSATSLFLPNYLFSILFW